MEEKEKFYKKDWFMWLMLVLMPPVGIIMLWVKGKFNKKTRQILTAIFSVWFIILSISSYQQNKEEKAEQAIKQAEYEDEKVQKEIEEKEAAKKKVKEEKKEEERKANRTTSEAVEEDSDNVDEASMNEGELTLRFKPGTMWSENSLMRVVRDMFKEVKIGFEDEEVDSVVAMIEVEMVDEKGNEEIKPVITYRYTRDDFEELNYDKFLEMSAVEEWRILNEAESYFIHPGIRKNLKDKYIQNLR